MSVNLFRNRWDLELIAQAFLGVSRFADFKRELGISTRMLATRLTELVAEDIFTRDLYQSRPDRHEYRLTNKGEELLPVLIAMLEWSDRWRPQSKTSAHAQLQLLASTASTDQNLSS